MNKVYVGAILCALFYGWGTVAGCIPGTNQAPIAATVTAAPATVVTTPTPPASAPATTSPDEAARAAIAGAPPVALATETPAASAAQDSAPAPAPIGTVVVYEDHITLPTYPIERYQSDAVDPTYNWPYKRFDVERFQAEAPMPELRDYRLLVLENVYLKVLVLPELGGRIWQVIHKPSGMPIFYQNTVVKPTHWGMADQLGWLALGGLEWSLPVIEHGYDWGTPWGYIPLQQSEDLATVTVVTPNDGRWLNASITITLRAGAASFEIQPTLTNLADHTLAFSFWHDAMLAPGSGKRPSAALHFVLPSAAMTLHSTGDSTLPAPGGRFTWPSYQGRDLSRLGNFTQYLGFFEAPAAQGPFVGVYDPVYDTGVVRSFPAEIAQGSKVFALGWQDALASSNYTDDQSAYVELHGGLAPTFDDQYTLPAGGVVDWREVWYPVQGIGDLTYANEIAALAVDAGADGIGIKLYATRPLDGSLRLLVADAVVGQLAVAVQPDAPFAGQFAVASQGPYTVELQDSAGRQLLTYSAE